MIERHFDKVIHEASKTFLSDMLHFNTATDKVSLKVLAQMLLIKKM